LSSSPGSCGNAEFRLAAIKTTTTTTTATTTTTTSPPLSLWPITEAQQLLIEAEGGKVRQWAWGS